MSSGSYKNKKATSVRIKHDMEAFPCAETHPMGRYVRSSLKISDNDDDDDDEGGEGDNGDVGKSRERDGRRDERRSSIMGRRKSDFLGDDFTVTLLGTGSGGLPSSHRMSSATALRLGGRTLLFDCAEGLQRQLGMSRIDSSSIEAVFVTHLHGDHLYGLPGLILNIHHGAQFRSSMGHGQKRRPMLDLYGPPGLYAYVASVLTLSCARIRFMDVTVHELTGGEWDSGPPIGQAMYNKSRRGGGRGGGRGSGGGGERSERNLFTDPLPEVRHVGIKRRTIPRSVDGTWTISKPDLPRTPEEVLDRTNAGGRGGEDHNGRRTFRIRAAEVHHVPGVQTYGYVVEEPPSLRKIDAKRATELGVSPGKKYQLLKHGFPVRTDDGSGAVMPDDVLLGGDERSSSSWRKFAILGDHHRKTEAMTRLCEGADVLIHEATLLAEEKDGDYDGNVSVAADATKAVGRADVIRGHATAEEAGDFAARVGASLLILNHISSRVVTMGGMELVRCRAEAANRRTRSALDRGEASRRRRSSEVMVGFDFMEVGVPRNGYDWNNAYSGKKTDTTMKTAARPTGTGEATTTSGSIENEIRSFLDSSPLSQRRHDGEEGDNDCSVRIDDIERESSKTT